MKRFFSLFVITISILGFINAQHLERVKPESVGIDGNKIIKADIVIQNSIEKGEIPGAVLAVVKDGKMAYIKSYGNKSVYPKVEKMTDDVIFDLASVSKSVGTAIAVMQLIERGDIRLYDNVSMYIPGFRGYFDSVSNKEIDIRIVDLLTHSSGLPPYAPVQEIVKTHGSPSPKGLIEYISNCKRDFRPTTKFQYSCLNFVTLQNIVQNVTGLSLSEYVSDNIFTVLGMNNSMYNPSKEMFYKIAPTEKEADGGILVGRVHDPLARILNDGNSGNAGVFSNADDLAILAAALINGGEYNGNRILGKLSVETMTTVPEHVITLGRSLGWDNYSSYASNHGNIFHPKKTYGHTGYTGTSFVVDPVSKTAVILLTNRVHPYDKNSVVRLRALVANIVAGSIIE